MQIYQDLIMELESFGWSQFNFWATRKLSLALGHNCNIAS